MDTMIRHTDWTTGYGSETLFRIAVIDDCTGSKLTECHHVQYQGDNAARCMNSSKVTYVADSIECGTFDASDPATWDAAPFGYEWREIDALSGEQHLFAPDGTNISAAYYAAENAAHIADNDAIERQIMSGESDDVVRAPRDTTKPRFSYRKRTNVPPVTFSDNG